jgi:drug/metabolite transporter (DMT)-like permease
MVYGTALLAGLALVQGKPFILEMTPAYLGSLAWLAVFSSFAAFAAYMTLLSRIGAARAGYATVLFPVFALMISTVAEGYQWSLPALIGLALVLVGNVIVLVLPRPA